MRIAVILALAATACGGIAAEPSGPQTIQADGRAIDGDTVSFDVRLYGADAFERRQMCATADGCWACGKAAQDFASRILKTGVGTIRLTGQQSYGRPVGTIEVNGQDLGEAMIGAGLAVPATTYLKTDPQRATAYVAAFERARTTNAGAHIGDFVNPADWRRGERLSCEGKRGGRRPSRYREQ